MAHLFTQFFNLKESAQHARTRSELSYIAQAISIVNSNYSLFRALLSSFFRAPRRMQHAAQRRLRHLAIQAPPQGRIRDARVQPRHPHHVPLVGRAQLAGPPAARPVRDRVQRCPAALDAEDDGVRGAELARDGACGLPGVQLRKDGGFLGSGEFVVFRAGGAWRCCGRTGSFRHFFLDLKMQCCVEMVVEGRRSGTELGLGR